ncbi:MAG: MbnP family protein [Bacteroidota bacterium]
MNSTTRTGLAVLLVSLTVFLAGCKKDQNGANPDPDFGGINIQFKHVFNGIPLVLDTLGWTDDFNNSFEINELQYFISDIRLHLKGGGAYQIATADGIHYVDARIPESHQWLPVDQIPPAIYDSVSFTFGLNAVKNLSNRFPDPPERDMFWPEILGGGYHYMKLNTKWKNDTVPELRPFMMHLGIGQIYDPVVPDSIIGYVQNFFFVKLDSSAFEIESGKLKTLVITMHLERWFDGPPNAFNLATMPPGIMQNQPLMHKVCLNGRGVFSVKIE